jgi:serine/threonine protein phosphatase PrpC
MSEAPASKAVAVKAFGLTDVGSVRKNNEDALLIAALGDGVAAAGAVPPAETTFDAETHAVVLAVSDGVGGADAGEVASALVVESLRRALAEPGSADWSLATKRAVETANAEVWEAAHAPGRHGMGATVTAVCVHGAQAHIAEVGDSRAYILRGGRIRQITKDQSFVQYLVDAGAMTAEEAAANPMKNVVLQAMGQKPDVQVALGRLELRRGDKLLLCSDGLSGKLSGEDMLATVQQSATLEGACRALVALANERGGEDNITVIVAAIDGEGLQPPRDAETVTQTLAVVQAYTAAGFRLASREDDPSLPDEAVGAIIHDPHERTLPEVRAESTPAGKPDLRRALLAALVGLAVAAIVFFLQRR